MINVPHTPFRVLDAGDEHPFVANALRSRKHYELCWCGSGRKYKRCHAVRKSQPPLPVGQILNDQDRIFWRSRGCMHPSASETVCKGAAIDAHTIQRKGPLGRIVDESNHVLNFRVPRGGAAVEVVRIGWKRASTFPGYCATHDASLFRTLETQPFSGSHEQCVLLAFRNLCSELYRKKALVESLEYQREVLDRGRDFDGQIEVQLSLFTSMAGQLKSIQEFEDLRLEFERAILTGTFDTFVSRCYFFTGELAVVSSSMFQCEFDFSGRHLVDLWDLHSTADMLSHSVVDTEDGGAIVFVWHRGATSAAATVNSFEDIAVADKADIFIQYCFLQSENTYCSPAWWDSLAPYHRALVRHLAGALHYNGGAFVPNHPPLVSWKL